MFKFGRKIKTNTKVGLLVAIIITAITILTVAFIPKEVKETVISKVRLNKQNEYQATATVDGITWAYTIEDGKAINVNVSSGLTDEITTVTIPSVLDGYTVVSICTDSASTVNIFNYFSNDTVETINIPNSVITIGELAFRECTSLTSINIPSSVINIDEGAFLNCKNLTSIDIPSSVTNIGDAAFFGCKNLTNITIDENNKNYCIKDGILYNIDQTILIRHPGGENGIVTIPDSVTQIGAYAFSDYIGLTSVILGENINSIENYAFYGCINLRNINIPNSVTSIGAGVFRECTSLTSIEIPNSVTSIENYAFKGCTSLTSIEIPNSVTSIENHAFEGCTGLIEITVDEENLNYCSYDGILYNKEKTKIIQYPCKKVADLQIPNTVTSISSEFNYSTGLRSVIIPSSVTTIYSGAFYDCTGLTNITVDDNNPKYSSENGILYNNKEKTKIFLCPKAKQGKITIPSSMTKIGDADFFGCTSLTEIDIPNSVTSIGSRAFYGCTGLTNINIPNSVTSIGDYAFKGCTSLTSIEIPNSVTSIGLWAFNGAKLTVAVAENSDGDYILKLPDIIKRSMIENDILYVNNNFTLTNCILNEDKTKLNVDSRIVDNKEVGMYLKQGALQGLNLIVVPSGRITYSSTMWTNEDVIARLYITNEEYIQNNNGENVYTFNENGNFTFRYLTNENEEKEVTAIVNNIDKTSPSLIVTGNPTSWTKQDAVLNITSSDSASGLAIVTVNGTEVELENDAGTYTVTANGTYEVVATDNAGNTTTKTVVVDKIDKINPRLSVTGNPTTWINEDVTLTITSSDSSSGLAGVTVNGTEIELINGVGRYTVIANGSYEVISTDNVGNTTTKTVVVDKIDKINPRLSVTGNPTMWTKEDVVLAITSSDSASGLASVTVNGETIVLTNGTGTYTVSENGTYTVIAIDNAANTITETVVVDKIDKTTKPSLQVISSTTEWTKENVILNITASSKFGLQSVQVNGNNVEINNEQFVYTVTENGTYKATVTDMLGNKKEEDIVVNNIDKIAPTISSIIKSTNEEVEELILTVNAIDNGSNIAGYSWDNGETWINENTYRVIKNDTYKVQVKDKVGNVSEDSIIVSNIKEEKEPEQPEQPEDPQEPIIVKNYEIKEEGNTTYILGISSNTIIEKFIENIQSNDEIKIVDKNDNMVGSNSLIATGMKIKAEEKEYILVVKGDLNSDGKTDITDLSIIARYVVGKVNLNKLYEYAGDINKDGKIDITDLSIFATVITRKLQL